MRKKIYKFVSVTVIAVAMVVSFQMSKANNATTLTMENVEAIAMADFEEIDWPQDVLHCKCHNDGQCWGGNLISFRPYCGSFPSGQGNCNDFDDNCPPN